MTVYLTEKAAFRLRSFIRANADQTTTEKGVRLDTLGLRQWPVQTSSGPLPCPLCLGG